MELLFSKFTAAAQRHGLSKCLAQLAQVGMAAMGVMGTIVASLVGFLAMSAETSDTNDASDNSAGGGILNFRTGRLDDGTDPAGWYEDD